MEIINTKTKILRESRFFPLIKQFKTNSNLLYSKKRAFRFIYKVNPKSLLRIVLLPVLFCSLIFINQEISAQTHTTIANGNWTSPSTWASGSAPPSSGTISSSRVINIRHRVTYNGSGDIKNSGTIRIEPVSGTNAELIMPSGRSIENNSTGKIYIINGKLTQFRFAGGGNSGSAQSGSFKNLGGYVQSVNSYIEIAQDWTTENGGVRVFRNSCLLTGQNFTISGTNTRDTIIETSISIGWHGSGNFQLSSGSIHFQQAKIQLAGTSGNFQLSSGTANGDIDYITLKNHITNNIGSGEIFASSSLNVTPILNLDAYCVNPSSQYKPNGKFSGAQIRNCNLNFFPCTVCIDTRSTIVLTDCDSTLFNSEWLTESGTFNDTIRNTAGCDSIITLNLTIINSTNATIELVACDSTLFNSEWLTESGTFYDTIQNTVGCDSVITLNLTIINSTNATIELVACDSTFFNSEWLTESGTFYDTIQNTVGCDSVITLNLTIINSTNATIELVACDSTLFNSEWLTESGTFYDTIQNTLGCDSVITLNLTIINSTNATIELFACDSTFFNSEWLTESGTFYDTIQNTLGCDSVITLNLTINYTTDSTIELTTCDSTFFNSEWLTESGTFYDTIQNTAGCDSVITLILLINNSSSSSIELTTCDSTFFNSEWLTESGTFYDTIQNTLGCDSVIALHLIINNSTNSIVEVTTCDSTFFNSEWLSETGTFYDTIQNTSGCDSIITLKLKIGLDVNLGNDTTIAEGCILLDAGPGEYFNWCNGDEFQKLLVCESGVYCVTVMDGKGCVGSDTIIIIIENNIPDAIAEPTSDIEDLEVYPNPNNKTFNLNFSIGIAENILIKITDNIGGTIYQENLDNFSGKYLKQIDFSDFAAGVYFVTVQHTNAIKTIKVVKN